MVVRIYTDGACSGNPGPGGWAALLLFAEEQQMISGFVKDTTNNCMELLAVAESLKLAKDLGYKRIYIYSDSAYIINAINNGWLKKWKHNGWKTIQGGDVKNKELWTKLESLLSSELRFIKVKGHSGDKNNELVDVQAKREIEKNT